MKFCQTCLLYDLQLNRPGHKTYIYECTLFMPFPMLKPELLMDPMKRSCSLCLAVSDEVEKQSWSIVVERWCHTVWQWLTEIYGPLPAVVLPIYSTMSLHCQLKSYRNTNTTGTEVWCCILCQKNVQNIFMNYKFWMIANKFINNLDNAYQFHFVPNLSWNCSLS